MEKNNSIKNFFINSLNGMAYGLFATLIIGTIVATISGFFKQGGDISLLLKDISFCIQTITGAGIGIGISLMLKLDSLKTISLASVGQLASYLSLVINKDGVSLSNGFKIGDPLTIYLVVIGTYLLIKLILRKKTPVDILIIPFLSIFVGIILILLIRYPAIYITYFIQYIINTATTYQPFIMGVIISVLMGMALTAPISSAAIAAMVFTGNQEGLLVASGEALIGCCTQMIGFSIQSRRDNSIGIVLSIFVGTSMLQFKNILRRPIIWLPTIITSAILGPISTCVLKMKCMGSSCGMGTAGFVGQLGTLNTMGNSFNTWLVILLFQIIAPAILVFLIDLIFRKYNLIKEGDLKI